MERNVLRAPLDSCSSDPLTGFYRDGCCRTDPDDLGSHAICAVVSAEFLEYQQSIGNDLSSPAPEYDFPGLEPGDRWCVTTRAWLSAHHEGVAAFVVLAATHKRAHTTRSAPRRRSPTASHSLPSASSLASARGPLMGVASRLAPVGPDGPPLTARSLLLSRK
jgi:uncharacterized protein (DUF2237 family)